MQLDIDRLVAYFGGVNALAEALKQHDPENAATTAAIYKWRTRGSLPLAQLQKLTALAEAQGRPLDLNAFLQKNESLERTEMTDQPRNYFRYHHARRRAVARCIHDQRGENPHCPPVGENGCGCD